MKKLNNHTKEHTEEISKREEDQTLITKRNKYFNFILNHYKLVLLLILLFVLLIPLTTNLIRGNPLVMGEESYANLLATKQITVNNLQYWPLNLLQNIFPEALFFLIPILLAVSSLFLFISLAKKFNLSDKFTFFYLLFVILAPAFIYVFSTISLDSFFIVLVLGGFFLLLQEKKILQVFSLIPFFFAASFDIFRTIILLGLILLYLYNLLPHKNIKRKKVIPFVGLGLAAIILVANLIFINKSFLRVNTTVAELLPNLISDFGGLSGISFFTLLLALIGLTFTWKKKKFYLVYILLLLVGPFYVINLQTVFLLALVLISFATIAFTRIFEKDWVLASIKKFAFFLLILGIIFSTLTYLNRITDEGPTLEEKEALLWIKENTPEEIKVFSIPENNNYIKYFAERDGFTESESNKKEKNNLTATLLNALYIDELFPLLEENNISIIYITPQMKAQLTKEWGFLFLLKNERFKLVHSHDETEVWMFKDEEAEISVIS